MITRMCWVPALGLAALHAEASATTLANLTVEQITDASTYIVEGTITEVWTELDAKTGMVWTVGRVSVSDTLKGPDSPTELVISSAGGEYGDYSVWIPSMAVFSRDEDVFLFLDQLDGGRLVPVAKAMGKYTVRRAPGDVESYVRTWEAVRPEPFDARFLPHPALEKRVYLTGFRDRVRTHLGQSWDGVAIPGKSMQKLQEINAPARRSR